MIFVLLICLTIVPVMISARVFNAANTGLLSCLLAVVASAAATTAAENMVTDPSLAFLVSTAITAFLFSIILGAKYIQSVMISIMTIGIQVGVLVAYVGASV